jgi:FAD:protein FMN transferase
VVGMVSVYAASELAGGWDGGGPAGEQARASSAMMVSFFPMPNRCVIGGLLLLAATGGMLPAQETRYEFAQLHMGMEVRLVLYSDEATVARTAAAAAFDQIRKLEDTMSDYRDESEVRRLGRRAGEWVTVSADLYAVLAAALELARESDGAFDPTVAPVVALWRRARASGILPPADALRSARDNVGWRLVELDRPNLAVRLARAGVALDLGGIAKGYILDRALESLRAAGVSRALLVAGGDIVAGDAPPDLEGWSIELEGAGDSLTRRAGTLANQALATSGDSEQFVEIGGVRYSHVVDPRTGQALTHGRRATVVDSGGLRRLREIHPDAMIDVVGFTPDSNATPDRRPPRSGPFSGRYPPR